MESSISEYTGECCSLESCDSIVALRAGIHIVHLSSIVHGVRKDACDGSK